MCCNTKILIFKKTILCTNTANYVLKYNFNHIYCTLFISVIHFIPYEEVLTYDGYPHRNYDFNINYQYR